MGRTRKLAFALLLALASPLSGCVVGARGTVAYDVEVEPPPPRHVVVVSRPGYLWIDGNWQYSGGRWVWNNGYYERQRTGYVYVQGRWVGHGRGHRWEPGRWKSHGRGPGPRPGVIVDDHRGGRDVEVVPARRGGKHDKHDKHDH